MAKRKPAEQSEPDGRAGLAPNWPHEPLEPLQSVEATAPDGPAAPSGPRIRNKGLRRVRVADLVDHELNPRTHPQGQREGFRGVVEEVGYFGYQDTIELPDGRLKLIDGHLRKEDLIQAYGPDTEIDVNVTDFDSQEAKKAMATKDHLASMAGVDVARMEELLAEVEIESPAMQAVIDDMWDRYAEEDESGGAGGVSEDEPPPLPVVPVSRLGDIWLCGNNRVMCGDSTVEADVALLMNGERAGLMNTDAPYGVSYANAERPNPGVAKPRVANDEAGGEDLQAFLESAFRPAVSAALKPDAAWYLWHANLTEGFFAAAAAAADVVMHRTIVWVKPVLLLGRGQYHWKHEVAFFGWVRGHQPPDYGLGNGERTQTTVWEVGTVTNAERKEFDHSTPKPVKLFEIPIVKHLKPGEICYEPFSGSGPQLIAAQQLNRRCFAMELDPKFVDCNAIRWSKLTGEQPILEETGETFEQVKARRAKP